MNRILIALALSYVVSSLVMAAHTAAESNNSNKTPVVGKVTLGVAVAEQELITRGWRASKLISADVRNDRNEKVGSIEDIVVAPDGTVSVAIIQAGGFLGMGAHLVAIPVRQLAITPNGDKIVLAGATKDALKSLPEFKYMK